MVQKDVHTYFRYCPLCYSEDALTVKVKKGWGGQDSLDCSHCGARWNFQVGKWRWNFGKLESAELTTDGVDGRGKELLGRKEKPDFWQRLALVGLRAKPAQPQPQMQPTMIREVIKEVVLIQCRSCNARYPQGTLKCLTCGANL